MNNWDYASKLPTSPWRGQMSLARKLSLVRDQSGLALAQDPVIDPLRKAAVPLHLQASSGSQGATATLSPPYELDFEEVSPSAKSFGVRIYYDDQHWTEIGFDKAKGEFYIDRTRSGETSIPAFAAKTTAPVVPGRPYNVKADYRPIFGRGVRSKRHDRDDEPGLPSNGKQSTRLLPLVESSNCERPCTFMETSISLARRRSRTRPEQPLRRTLAMIQHTIARRTALDRTTFQEMR